MSVRPGAGTPPGAGQTVVQLGELILRHTPPGTDLPGLAGALEHGPLGETVELLAGTLAHNTAAAKIRPLPVTALAPLLLRESLAVLLEREGWQAIAEDVRSGKSLTVICGALQDAEDEADHAGEFAQPLQYIATTATALYEILPGEPVSSSDAEPRV